MLARVEGEGAMHVRIRDGEVDEVQLRIYEPPRFFEALLRGRRYTEPPDITSRICGICPIAYQMSACAAIEDACGVTVDEPIRLLRRLIYCGEWLESHALHVFMLHAPDFLGYDGVVAMAADHREIVERGLQIKKSGNELIRVIGGREVHPINLRVGGFWRAPGKRELRALLEPLKRARENALETVRWSCDAGLSRPRDGPRAGGPVRPGTTIRSSAGGSCRAPGSTSSRGSTRSTSWRSTWRTRTRSHSSLRERGSYLTGPLARYGLASDRLSPLAREAAAEAGLGPVCLNPFQSIVVRCVEILYALDEAIRIIEAYEEPDRPAVEVPPRAGTGYGWTEAPRGMLWHSYTLDDEGTILDAKIVPPTSQNQRTIEEDLRALVGRNLDLSDEALQLRCEQAIRNFDPCISCATHFLTLTVDRG